MDIQVPFLASTDTILTGQAACYTHVEGTKLGSTLVFVGTTPVGEAENSTIPLSRG